MEAAPYIRDGLPCVPVRYAGCAMGLSDADIVWDEPSHTVLLPKNGSTVKLLPGSRNMWINRIPPPLDVVPEIISGRISLPVAWIADDFGQEAAWDGGAGTVTITLK